MKFILLLTSSTTFKAIPSDNFTETMLNNQLSYSSDIAIISNLPSKTIRRQLNVKLMRLERNLSPERLFISVYKTANAVRAAPTD